MVRDELPRLRANTEAEAAALARDLEAVFAASRDSFDQATRDLLAAALADETNAGGA